MQDYLQVLSWLSTSRFCCTFLLSCQDSAWTIISDQEFASISFASVSFANVTDDAGFLT